MYKRDHKRFDEYNENLELKKGNAFTYWGLNKTDYYKHFNPHNELTYINYNYFDLYSKRMADLVIGEGFTLTTESSEVTDWLNQWIERSNYSQSLFQRVEYGSVFGDAPAKLYTDYNSDGYLDICLDFVNPEFWYPKVNKYNPYKEPNRVDLLIQSVEVQGFGKVSLVESHRPNEIIYLAFTEGGGGKTRYLDPMTFFEDILEDIEELELVKGVDEEGKEYDTMMYRVQTNIPYPLVTNYKNESSYDDYFGLSDYSVAMKSIVYAINTNLTDINATNQDTRNPLYSVPNGTVKQIMDSLEASQNKNKGNDVKSTNPYKNGTTLEQIPTFLQSQQGRVLQAKQLLSKTLREGRVLEKGANDESIEVVEHNPQMDNSFTMLKELDQKLMKVTEMSPVLFETDQSYGNLSGTALRNLAQATLKKVARKASHLKNTIKRELMLVQLLAIEMGTDSNYPFPISEPVKVSIEMKDGFVQDSVEMTDSIIKQLESGLISKAEAVAKLQDITIDEAKTKLEDMPALTTAQTNTTTAQTIDQTERMQQAKSRLRETIKNAINGGN